MRLKHPLLPPSPHPKLVNGVKNGISGDSGSLLRAHARAWPDAGGLETAAAAPWMVMSPGGAGDARAGSECERVTTCTRQWKGNPTVGRAGRDEWWTDIATRGPPL